MSDVVSSFLTFKDIREAVQRLLDTRSTHMTDAERLRQRYFDILRNDYKVSDRFMETAELDSVQLPDFGDADVDAYFAYDKSLGNSRPSGIVNKNWRDILALLLKGFPLESEIHRTNLYVGIVPDYRFDAFVTSSRDARQHLILVSSGLMMFYFRFTRILAASMSIRFSDEVLKPELDFETAQAHAQLNLTLFYDGQHMMPLRLREQARRKYSIMLTVAMEAFVLAHELGHVLDQLLRSTSSDYQALVDKLSSDDDRAKPWADELVADARASMICRNALHAMAERWEAPESMLELVVAEAPFVVMRLASAFEDWASAHGVDVWKTHPPSKLRALYILDRYRRWDIPDKLDAAVRATWMQVGDLIGSAPDDPI